MRNTSQPLGCTPATEQRAATTPRPWGVGMKEGETERGVSQSKDLPDSRAGGRGEGRLDWSAGGRLTRSAALTSPPCLWGHCYNSTQRAKPRSQAPPPSVTERARGALRGQPGLCCQHQPPAHQTNMRADPFWEREGGFSPHHYPLWQGRRQA